MTIQHQFFVKHLLEWNQQNNTRQMPWNEKKTPIKYG